MIYMKHKEHGNVHVEPSKQKELEAQGYVRFPHGDDPWVQSVKVEAVIAIESSGAEESKDAPKRRGRPPKE